MRRYTNDTFHGLYYLHNLNILHSDVKPENIMYIRGKTNQSEGQLLKLVDFGMSCIPGSTDHKCGDYYLQPRFYRSPESILCLPVTTKCDIFSVGVLLVEFIIGFPPFMGNNEVAQLAAMMQVLGFPPSHLIDISQRKEVFAAALDFTILNGFHQNPYLRNLNELLEGLNPLLIDLITRCLKWDPKVRITAEEALRHPYLTIN
uniref:dual specificity tyrosine-phosphorylation-regulated kinase 2-like n=1 Tax=Styela clava TaxID=7725 RepID=UPI00193A940D|nr:dual specificity tyrosine-phosphorylation-regulated kinase 2-like [Styela clava]